MTMEKRQFHFVFPKVDEEGKMKVQPIAMLERQLVKRKNEPMVEWTVQWANAGDENAKFGGC